MPPPLPSYPSYHPEGFYTGARSPGLGGGGGVGTRPWRMGGGGLAQGLGGGGGGGGWHKAMEEGGGWHKAMEEVLGLGAWEMLD